MPPRTRVPSTRRSKFVAEPAVEVLEEEESGEDMEVSEDDVPIGGVSSDQGEDEGEEDQVDEDEDEEEEVEVDDAEEEGEEEKEEEEEQEDELSSSSPSPAPTKPKSKSTPTKPRLKIKLKFSGVSNTNATPTPSDEMPLRPTRRGPAKHIESSSESEESSRSASFAGPSRMTHRQAALAGMVEATELVSLEETASKKKKYLNEAELALKREETARKRKNLSVKKLEDEKAETINRLLKKQSRPRGKKSALAAVEDEEADPEAEDSSVPAPVSIIPTTFRWISSSKPDTPAFTFSVPVGLLPEGTDKGSSRILSPTPPALKAPPACDVSGCTRPRKYKLVKDPTRGGCGMEHLKALQVQ